MTYTISPTTASSTALLAVDDLAIHVGGRALLQGISFRLHAGEALSLVGESGAGKSLLAQAIMGNLPPALRASGAITIDGVTTRAEDAASRRALSARIDPGAPLNVKGFHVGVGARRIAMPSVRRAIVNWSRVATPVASMVWFCSAGIRAASSSTR